MKKLYEYMYQKQIGDGLPGTWSGINRLLELQPILVDLETAKWIDEPVQLQYNESNIKKLAQHLDLTEDTVCEWMFDPKYKKFQDATITARILDPSQISLIEKICNLLNLLTHKVDIRLQNQKPGEMVALHLDVYKHHVFDLPADQEHRVRRYAIFLDDQQLGQTWFINNDFLHWKKGDVYTWDQSRVPHGTANIGYHDRPVLIVTGIDLT
jgi:hypothetical protein